MEVFCIAGGLFTSWAIREDHREGLQYGKTKKVWAICIASLHSRDLAGKDLTFGTFHLKPLDKNHSLQHMPRELWNLRLGQYLQEAAQVLLSIRTWCGEGCPVSMREGTEAIMARVITTGMNDRSGYTQWVLHTHSLTNAGLCYGSKRF